MALLVDFYFVHTSEYYNAPAALMLCGILAPGIQQLGVLLGKEGKPKALPAFLDYVIAVFSVLVIMFGDDVTYNFYPNYPTVNYYFDPGPAITTTGSIIASIIVIGIAFWPTRVSEKTSVNAT